MRRGRYVTTTSNFLWGFLRNYAYGIRITVYMFSISRFLFPGLLDTVVMIVPNKNKYSYKTSMYT